VPLIANPSDFTFTFVHGDNTRSFFLLYDLPVTGSDCAVQLTTPDGQSLAADTGLACDSLSQNLTLPEATLPNGWGGTTARLVRSGDGEVIADIGALACTEMSNSTTSTPTLDENCDGVFEGGIIGNSEVDRSASDVLMDGAGPVHIAAGEENARLICEDFDEALVSFTTREQTFNGVILTRTEVRGFGIS
jgi:hypothetical protein